MKVKTVVKAISALGGLVAGLVSIGAVGVGVAIAASEHKHNQDKRKYDPYEHY